MKHDWILIARLIGVGDDDVAEVYEGFATRLESDVRGEDVQRASDDAVALVVAKMHAADDVVISAGCTRCEWAYPAIEPHSECSGTST